MITPLKMPKRMPEDEKAPLLPTINSARFGDEMPAWALIMAILKMIIGQGMLAHVYAYTLGGYSIAFADLLIFATAYANVVLMVRAHGGMNVDWFDMLQIYLGKNWAKYVEVILVFGRTATLTLFICIMGGCLKNFLGFSEEVETLEIKDLAHWKESILEPRRAFLLFLSTLACAPGVLVRKYNELTTFNVLGNVAIIAIYIVFLQTFLTKDPATHITRKWTTDFSALPHVIGLSMYVAPQCGDPAIIDLYRRNKLYPGSESGEGFWWKALIAYATGFVITVSFSLGCYEMYGDKVLPNVLQNLVKDSDLALIAMILVFANGAWTIGVIANPIFLRFERYFSNTSPMLIRLLGLAVCCALSICVPNIADFLMISGCFLQGQYKFLLPAVLYFMSPVRKEDGYIPSIVATISLGIGILFCSCGVIRFIYPLK